MSKSVIGKTLKGFEDTSHWMRSKIYFVIVAFLCQESKQVPVFTSVRYGQLEWAVYMI